MAVLNEEPKKANYLDLVCGLGYGQDYLYDYVCSKKNVLSGAKWLDTIYTL